MTTIERIDRLQTKAAALDKVSRKDVEAKLDDVRALVVKAECQLVVTGAISGGILDAISSALNILIPLTGFLGDWELTGLLNSLKIWLEKQKNIQAQEDAERNMMTDLGQFW